MTGNRHLRLVLALCAAVTTWAASTLALARPARADAATVAAASHAGFSPGAGILWESDADLARDLDAMAATGASWIRLDFAWSSIEATRAVFSWAATDRVVDAARARGL